MSWQNSPIYTDPHQFEPLLPSAARIEPLLTKAHDLSRLAAKQRLAVAHIKAEEALERLYQGAEGARALYTAEAVQDIHRELFDRIPPSDLFTPKNEPIVPGQLRTREVRLDPHVAPAFISAPLFLARWASFYGNVRRGEAALVALAAAHQRLSWIHPFIDGNERVMRLHTHTLLNALDTPADCGRHCAALRAARIATTPCWPTLTPCDLAIWMGAAT